MAKKDEQELQQQLDLFPVDPEIRGLSISDFKIKNGTVDATLTGVTMVSDVAQINDETWKKALAEWLINLCGNNSELIDSYIDEAKHKAYELERDREAMRKAMANAKNLPTGDFVGA